MPCRDNFRNAKAPALREQSGARDLMRRSAMSLADPALGGPETCPDAPRCASMRGRFWPGAC